MRRWLVLIPAVLMAGAVAMAADVAGRFKSLVVVDNITVGGVVVAAAGAVSLDNTTMDNTVIGGTTPAAGSFSSLTRGTVSDTEFSYLDGVTSAIQTQLGLKAPLASPTFTGTVTIPTPFTLGATSVTPTGTELNYVGGVTSAIQTQINAKQATVTEGLLADSVIVSADIKDGEIVNADVNASAAIDATKIGSGLVSNTELDHVDNVTAPIQIQIDAKETSTATLTDLSDAVVANPITFNDDVYLKLGTDNDFTVRYKSADATLVIALDNTDVMCTFSKTGNLTCAGEATFSQYNSAATDNTYGINVMNSSDPSAAYLEGGLFWFNGTDGQARVRNSDNTVTIPIGGALTILDNVAGPTAGQVYGSHNIVNAAITVTLPTAVLGMSGCVRDTGTAHDIIVDIQGADTLTYGGTEDSAGDGITNASGTSTGDYICFVSHAAGKWIVTDWVGTWVAQ